MSGLWHRWNGQGLDSGKITRSGSKRFATIAALGAVFLPAGAAFAQVCNDLVLDANGNVICQTTSGCAGKSVGDDCTFQGEAGTCTDTCGDPGVACSCCTPTACEPPPKCVDPGHDCFTTVCDKSQYDFALTPLPQDFFGEGSDPFDGVVQLRGNSGGVDTVIERLAPMCFPDPLPHTENVEIQITQLHLVSCEPITVTFNGGQNPTPWNVEVFPGPNPQQIGSMTATKTDPSGGTFSASLPVEVAMFFVEAAGPGTAGPLVTSVNFQTVGTATWLQNCGVCDIPCEAAGLPTGGFSAGWSINQDTGSQCCTETCHANPNGGHDHCTTPPKCEPCPEPPVVDCPLATDLCTNRAAFGDCQGTDVERCWPKIVSIANDGTLNIEQCECFEDECGPVDVQTAPGGDLLFSCPGQCPDPALPCVIHLGGRSTGSPSITGSETGGQRVTCECETPPPPPDPHLSVQGTSLTFDTDDVPILPSGFFEPGSDPFFGTVNLQGAASDTLVQRDRPVDAPLVGSTDTIPIELVSLKLTSVSPITVTPSGTEWDVQVELSDTVPPNPVGSMDVTKTFDNGGTFDAQVVVRPKITFTRVDDATEVRTLDYGVESIPDILINFLGAHWVETLGAGLAGSILAPNDGNFVPGVVQNDPNDPDNSQKIVQATGNSKGGGVSHPVQPVPLCPLPFGSLDDPCAPFQARDCPQTGPDQFCLPTTLDQNGNVVACACRTSNECHLEFTAEGPICVGECPDPSLVCREVVGTDNDGDGVPDTRTCDCVPLPPPDDLGSWLIDDVRPSSSIEFGGGSVIPAIPADFFGPGSEPFSGQIPLTGQSINPPTDTSVRIQRDKDPDPALPIGGTEMIPIEILELRLVGTSPLVVRDANLTTSLWDLQVARQSTSSSLGMANIVKTHENGGTFDAFFDVFVDLRFTNVETGEVRELVPPSLKLNIFGASWVHQADPALGIPLPAGANFVPGVREDPDTGQQTREPFNAVAKDDPPSVIHSVCPPVEEEKVCIYRVTCVDGPCDACKFKNTGLICQAFRCPNDTCAPGFTTTCGPASDPCCLELSWTGECRVPQGEPFCPLEEPCACDPTPGACCQDDATCFVGPESKCRDGKYLGDGTDCGPEGKCCFRDGTCIPTFEACCRDQGGLFVAGGTCSPPVECCFPNGGCVDMDRECCSLFGGSPGPAGSSCDPPEECCVSGGRCVNTDPDCCARIFNGTPGGAGSRCADRQACCFPGGACANLDPDCCRNEGGVPQGSGVFCKGDANGNGIDDQCEGGFGVCPLPDAPIVPLCDALQNIDCRSLNPTNELCLPKSVVFDFFSGPRAVKCACFAPPPGPCGPIEVRQDPLLGRLFSCPGQCPNPDDDCQIHFNGSPTGKTTVLEGAVPLGTVVTCECGHPPRLEACCLPDGRCTFLTPGDCRGRKGKPLGPGSTCLGDNNNNGIDDACENEECEQCGPGPHWIHIPACPDGVDQDTFPSGAVLGIDTNLDCVAETSVVLGGPATIQKRGPFDDSNHFPGTRPIDGHIDVIDTEILGMNLTGGGGITLIAGAGLGAQPLPATLGAVAELPANPLLAESFFDVLAEITDLGGNKFYNQSPVRVQTVVPCLPPKRIYIHITGCTPLFDAPTGGNHVANLVRARHFTLPDCCLDTLCFSNVSVQECEAVGGKSVPACLGDNNSNGIDDACEDPDCRPRDDGLDCEPVNCPPDSTGLPQECRPTVIGIVPGTNQFAVLECDCTNTCHIELDAAVGPVCTGPCPNPDDECRLIRRDTDGDGADDWFACRCEPKPECKPNADKTACEAAECPDPDDICRPTKLAQTKTCFGALPPLPCKADADCATVPNSFCETKTEVLECECGGDNECRVAIEFGTTNPFCVGECPDPTQTCELTTSTQVNPDGTITVVSACDCVPPPPVCQPIPGALACEPTICPNAGEICRPTLVGIDVNGNLVVKECDCLRDDECHIEFTSAGPTCKGLCPDGNQVCELLKTDTDGDGVVDVLTCDCVPPPPPDCEPTADGFTCKPTICPDPTEFCVPKVVGFNPLTGQLEVLRCDCVREDECRVALGPAGPFCTGVCPDADSKCTLFKSDTTGDGIPDRFECDCVPPEPPVCEPTADGKACVPTECPNDNETCRPTKVRLIPGTTEVEVVECDCVDEKFCHVVVGSAGPACKGVCPDPNDVCRLQSADSDGDGVDDEFSCECIGLECKPTADGLSCTSPACPLDDQRCRARCARFDPETGNVRITECDCLGIGTCGVQLVDPNPSGGGSVAGGGGVDPCVVPDDGSGTVKLPPDGCPYLSPDEVHEIIDGLPAGTTIELGAIHKDFICQRGDPADPTICSFIPDGIDCAQEGGDLGGQQECHQSTLELRMVGNGELDGFNRVIALPVEFETHTGPRTPGDPVQTFPTDMFLLQGQISGDPDFDLLRITAGTGFGLPGPGQTTLTQLPSGDFQVDSFFDIEYRIDYVGAPGSALEGKSGSTTGVVRMRTHVGNEPTCDGLCPPGTSCVKKRTENPDGTIDICCECEVPCDPVDPVKPGLPDVGFGMAHRTIAIRPNNPGRLTAIRVKFVDLPGGYEVWNDSTLWVNSPVREVTEKPNEITTDQPTVLMATLGCERECRDWAAVAGGKPLHLIHEGILPGGRYEIVVEDCECPEPNESAPQPFRTSPYGDITGGFVANTWTPPDGDARVAQDVIAGIDKLLGKTEPSKPRVDTIGFDDPQQCLDLRVLIGDILKLIDGALGKPYPFGPTADDPCLSPCQLP